MTSSDSNKLRALEIDLLEAENNNDATIYGRILASDFRSVTPDGRVGDRSAVLDEARQRATMHFPYRVQHSAMQVFSSVDSAVIVYVKEYLGTEGEVKGKIRKQGFVDVFSKQGSQWKLLFTRAERDCGTVD